jgi:hypothetical protein
MIFFFFFNVFNKELIDTVISVRKLGVRLGMSYLALLILRIYVYFVVYFRKKKREKKLTATSQQPLPYLQRS